MTPWIQHLLALSLVALAALYVIYQASSSLRGKKSKLGNCCAKGCQPQKSSNPKPEQIVFFPVELLKKHK